MSKSRIMFLIFLKLKCEERDQNQVKVDEIIQLEDALGNSIDNTSLYYVKRVTKSFHKRWNDTSQTLNRCRNCDYPFIEQDDCFMLRYLRKGKIS